MKDDNKQRVFINHKKEEIYSTNANIPYNLINKVHVLCYYNNRPVKRIYLDGFSCREEYFIWLNSLEIERPSNER